MDVVLTVTGTGNVTAIKVGGSTVNTDNYTVNEDEVTLKKTYLATLEVGEKTFSITKGSTTVTVKITVEDTTTLTTDPATATFDKNTSNAEGYVDVEIEVKHNTTGVTLSSVNNGDVELTPTTHYTVEGLVVTILKTYLETLEGGNVTITFKTNKGDVNAVITIVDTTDEV